MVYNKPMFQEMVFYEIIIWKIIFNEWVYMLGDEVLFSFLDNEMLRSRIFWCHFMM